MTQQVWPYLLADVMLHSTEIHQAIHLRLVIHNAINMHWLPHVFGESALGTIWIGMNDYCIML